MYIYALILCPPLRVYTYLYMDRHIHVYIYIHINAWHIYVQYTSTYVCMHEINTFFIAYA